jgi:hypothetical protein
MISNNDIATLTLAFGYFFLALVFTLFAALDGKTWQWVASALFWIAFVVLFVRSVHQKYSQAFRK